MRKLALIAATLLMAFIFAPSSASAADAAAAAARAPSLGQSLIGSQLMPIDYRRYCRGYRCYYCKYRRCDYGDCRYWGCYWRGGGGGHRRGYRRRGGYY
jgi:hypothetical protein